MWGAGRPKGKWQANPLISKYATMKRLAVAFHFKPMEETDFFQSRLQRWNQYYDKYQSDEITKNKKKYPLYINSSQT